MIRVTTIIKIPAGKSRPMLNPEFKEIFDKQDAIRAKYQVSADLNSYQVVTEHDGSKTNTVVVYYNTFDDFNACVKELQEFKNAKGRFDRDNRPIDQIGEHSNIERKYRVVDTQTNEVLQDWTNIDT